MMQEHKVKREGISMLLSFSCSNHRSIRDRVQFSMMANKDPSHIQSLIPWEGNHFLRAAAIYGANGSGKTSFIGALGLLQILVVKSTQLQPGELTRLTPHKLAQEEPTCFDIQFTADGVRYAYGLTMFQGQVDEEYLYMFPEKRKTQVFERKGMEVTPGYRFRGKFKSAIDDVLKPNRLFLSCAANFSNVPEVERAFRFFHGDLVFYPPKDNNWRTYTVRQLEETPELKARFLAMLQRLGTGIQDFRVEWRETPAEEPINSEGIQTNAAPKRSFSVYLQYGPFETNLRAEESSGVQRLFEIICPMLDILDQGKVLIFDEIETSLHERLVWELLQIFLNDRSDPPAQLIFTTHDTSLLDLRLFRRDQIWFTELDQSRATRLYSLSDVKNVRKDENIARGYISGKYGAIPVLNRELIQACQAET